jgi:hypothetical protein
MTTTTTAARTTEGPTRALDPPAGPRYDGLADWYDAEVRRHPAPGRRPPPPLADLIEVFLAAGLTLRRIEEPGEDDYPFLLALVLER